MTDKKRETDMVAISPQKDIGIRPADEPIGHWFLEDGSIITYRRWRPPPRGSRGNTISTATHDA